MEKYQDSFLCHSDYPMNDILFFDIETTGFSPVTSSVYLIGVLHYNDNFCHMTQWFARTPAEESEVISAFLAYCQTFQTLVSFNGIRFDLPFIYKRAEKFHLKLPERSVENLDILQHLRPLRHYLKLSHMNQTSLEDFLGVERKDQYNGGELIKFYHQNCKDYQPERTKLLLLHNHDDLIGMIRLLPLLAYEDFIMKKNFTITAMEWTTSPDEQPQLCITLHLSIALPVPISCRLAHGYLTADKQTARLLIQAYEGTLKYFFSDYQNYYYLLDEDRAIHKSIATYVDKSKRAKAKASTCYQKRKGIFLPALPALSDERIFCSDYSSPEKWIECSDAFMNSPDKIFTYIEESLIFKI